MVYAALPTTAVQLSDHLPPSASPCTDGTDYKAIEELLVTFKPGGFSQQQVPITILNDDIAEGKEDFRAELALLPGETEVVLGEDSIAVVEIVDDDVGRFEITQPRHNIPASSVPFPLQTSAPCPQRLVPVGHSSHPSSSTPLLVSVSGLSTVVALAMTTVSRLYKNARQDAVSPHNIRVTSLHASHIITYDIST